MKLFRHTTRFRWLRRLNDLPMSKESFYSGVRRQDILFAQKFLSDFLADGYLLLSVQTGKLHVTSAGRRLLYDWETRREETFRYVLTTAIAVAALVIALLR